MTFSAKPDTALTDPTVIKAKLFYSYPGASVPILSGFDLTCRAGEIIALVGPSGCGKTTLLSVLAQVLPPNPRSYIEWVNEQSVNFSYAFQRAELIPWRNCEGNASYETDILDKTEEGTKPRIEHLLTIAHLDKARNLFPSSLSVGMQQRLQLVRACARPVKLSLLDEPLAAVDEPRRIYIARAMRDILKRDGTAVVWVTHDSQEAITVADRVLVLAGPPLTVVSEHAISRSLTEASDTLAESGLASTVATLDQHAAPIRQALLHSLSEAQESGKTADREVKSHSKTSAATADSISLLAKRVLSTLFALVPLLILLVVWQALDVLRPSMRFFLPAPSDWIPRVFTDLAHDNLARHILVTLRETFYGLGIGLPAGIVIGLLGSQSRIVSLMLRPYLVGLMAVPLFILAPAFILWFGIDERMKVAIAALSCFPFVSYLVLEAAQNVKGNYYAYLLKAGASHASLLHRLILPSVLEGIVLSVRPAAVSALIGAFLGEFISANEGLGYFIILQASRYRMADVLVGAFCLFSISLIIDGLAQRLLKYKNSIIGCLRL